MAIRVNVDIGEAKRTTFGRIKRYFKTADPIEPVSVWGATTLKGALQKWREALEEFHMRSASLVKKPPVASKKETADAIDRYANMGVQGK